MSAFWQMVTCILTIQKEELAMIYVFHQMVTLGLGMLTIQEEQLVMMFVFHEMVT